MKRAFLLVLIIISVFSCKPKEQEETSQEPNVVIEIVDEESESDSLDIAEEKGNDGRYWSSEETNLPIGVVVASDHSRNKNNLKDNYVTIKQTNKFLTIRRDIDEDLYLNLHDGDTIK